jgi:hypothetical protein
MVIFLMCLRINVPSLKYGLKLRLIFKQNFAAISPQAKHTDRATTSPSEVIADFSELRVLRGQFN